MAYKKIGIANLMPGGAFDWLQEPNKESMTRQEAMDAAADARVRQVSTAEAVNKSKELAGVEGQPTWKQAADNMMNPKPQQGGISQEQIQNAVNQYARRPLTEAQMEAEKNGANGEVVKLADQKLAPEDYGKRDVDMNGLRITPESASTNTADAKQNYSGEGGNTVATREPDPGVGGYDDILALMKANALSEGDMVRRQHSREIVTGLGDLVSSIANMWATTKGAPNAYDNAKGMTATSQSLYDRELARRKAQNENILNYYRVKKAAEDDAENREYRRQMVDIRREESEARAAARNEANELKREQLKLQREKEESAKKAREARIKYMDLLSDDKEIENAVYYGALAEAYDVGKDDEEAKSYARLKQRQYDDAQKVKSGKGKGKGGKSKSGNKSKKSSSTNTPPSRRSGNGDGNNVRPSQR